MSTGVEEVQPQPAIVSSDKRLAGEIAFVTRPVKLILPDAQESCCKKRSLATLK